MKAAVLYELKTPLKVEDVDLDNPKAGEVRVKIVANGVCHSDYSVIHGVLRSPLPVVPGHEGAGIVEEVGPEVTMVKPGDHVAISFLPACGNCRWCATGHTYLDSTHSARAADPAAGHAHSGSAVSTRAVSSPTCGSQRRSAGDHPRSDV